MIRRLLVVLVCTIALASTAQAQIIDSRIGRTGEPIAWTSLSIGWLQQQGLCDPASNACWEFASAPQWRGTLEMPMGRGASFGLAATIARVPLIYQGSVGLNSCASCDADANITQYLANVHIGDGTFLYQVIDLSAGMTVFSNFRSETGSKLGGKAVSDFTFAIGYGFGYNLSRTFQLMLVQEAALVIHKRQSGTTNNTAPQYTTRIGARVGLGEKRR